MATVSAMPTQRPRKVVRYGKAGSKSTYSTKHVDSWLAEEDDTSPPQAPSAAVIKNPKVTKTYTVKKPATKIEPRAEVHAKQVKKPASKPAKSHTIKQDAFDVPSSDDEAGMEYELKQRSPPRLMGRRGLVDDVTSHEPQLASWEKRDHTKKDDHGKIEAVPRDEAKSASPGKVQEVAVRAAENAAKPKAYGSKDKPQPLSAAARLAARRQQVNDSQQETTNKLEGRLSIPAKRAEGDSGSNVPRKRARKSPKDTTVEDVAMEDAPGCDMAQSATGAANGDLDVFDVPDDDDTATTKASPAQLAPRNPRRGKLASAGRGTPLKGVSAPARLTDMLPVDTDSSDVKSPSPSLVLSRPSTPRGSGTPEVDRGSQRPTSPAMTPKQAQLWSRLLGTDTVAPSPSSLAINDLTLAGRKRTAANKVQSKPALTRSSSEVPELHRRRTRLVDRLKAAASSSEDESSDSDKDTADDVFEKVKAEEDQPVRLPNDSESRPSQSESQNQSQSQVQSQASADRGTNVTYTSMRSYLPEDTLEDGLLLDMPSITPQRPLVLARQPSKNNSASQKSAFDLEDSEEEGAPGRLRTIHELRAAGRNESFMRDTEALLEDISDYSISARSRRRSALTELATKLMEKNYAQRFAAQGFEHKMLAECAAPADDIATVVLASAFAILLSAEIPQHTIDSLAAGGLIGWACGLLAQESSLAKMTRERRYNMAKSSQKSIADFAETMRTSEALWETTTPVVLSPRTVALKVLDLLVGRMRKLGDRSSLLKDAHLELVISKLSDADTGSAECATAISLLEALSTSAVDLSWPRQLLTKIGSIVQALIVGTDNDKRTIFLAFRLTLNLTNNNAQNCTILATLELVQALIAAVRDGFTAIAATEEAADSRAITMDLLVLALGILINLAEHSPEARSHSATLALASLLEIFKQAQDRLEDADSVEASTTNVAFGYLAIMLANLCLDDTARAFIAEKLPGKNLVLLVNAVDEFVRHHERVDMLGFEGTEGRAVWGVFTEKLRDVLVRLKGVA